MPDVPNDHDEAIRKRGRKLRVVEPARAPAPQKVAYEPKVRREKRARVARTLQALATARALEALERLSDHAVTEAELPDRDALPDLLADGLVHASADRIWALTPWGREVWMALRALLQ